MSVYVILCPYFLNNYFGVYTSLKRARLAVEKYLSDNDDIVSVVNNDNYLYSFTTVNGTEYNIEIIWDVIDDEFHDSTIEES